MKAANDAPILLDTHALVWLVNEEEGHLTATQRKAIAGARLFVSSITAWELAIHARRKRIEMLPDFPIWFGQAMAILPAAEVPLSVAIILASETMPNFPHGDPADRFIVATALVHGLRLVSVDGKIQRWARHEGAALLTLVK